MKVIAIANNLDNLEKCINEYLCSVGYQIILIKRINEKNKIEEMKYILENKRLEQDKVVLMNLEYTIKYKKGKYYFYRNEKTKK